ncbi:hypothetical protein JW935_17710, partial [candidate division KSB1 bacterium]|nr:hypothetical protein [candidate division KSB1 bacterium]
AILLFGLLYALNFSFLRWRLYEKDLAVMSGRKSRDMTSFSFLSKFGRIGTYIALELKLLWRNKRTRALVIMAFCILPLGFFIYSTIPFEEDSYIRPPARLETTDRQQDGQVAVTVKVTTDSLPDPAHAVFIVGNQDNIGQWKPDKTPLFHRQDSCWSRTFYYPGGTEMKYKLTLGSWNNQALTPSGSVPDPSTLRVVNDTTLAHHVTAWMIPERPFVFDINLVYMGIFFTGIFILLYGQFFFSFSGSFIEMMASRKIDLQAYFRAKHYLMITGAIVCWALCAVYAIYNVKIVFLNTALLLYNIGINSYILLYMATLTRKKMDLSQGLFSQQGRGGIQMLMILPTLVVPIAIHMSIRAMGYPNLGFYILGAMGLAGILCHKILFNFFLALFARQKYAMITGFRHTGE